VEARIGTAKPVRPIQEQHMQVWVQVERRADPTMLRAPQL